jgi:hypothetical protein
VESIRRRDQRQPPFDQRLLSVPSLRQRYIDHVRTLLDEALNLTVLKPKIEAYRSLIRDDVMVDTKKLYSNADFENSIVDVKNFIVDRRAFILSNPEIN